VAHRSPSEWLAQVETDGHGWAELHPLDGESVEMEAVLLGLRLVEGVGLDALAARGVHLEAARLADLRAAGLLSADTSRLQASPEGRLVLDHLIGRLLA
jgi:oxygen-independent coproporphyrinogen-3 oxidase